MSQNLKTPRDGNCLMLNGDHLTLGVEDVAKNPFASCLPQFSGDDCIDFDADLWVQEAHLNSWFIHVLFGKSISSDEKVTRLLGGGAGS